MHQIGPYIHLIGTHFWIPVAVTILLWWRFRRPAVRASLILRLVATACAIHVIQFVQATIMILELNPSIAILRLILALSLTRDMWLLWRASTSRRLPDVRGIKYFLLGGLLIAVIQLVWSTEIAKFAFERIAWEISSFRSMPFPYDFPQVGRSSASYFTQSAMRSVFSTAAWTSIQLTIGHFCIGIVALAGYAFFGWPRYWHVVKSRLRWSTIWSDSARRTWWIAPVVVAVYLSWLQLSRQTRNLPAIQLNVSLATYYAAILAVLEAYLCDTRFAFRRAAVDAIHPDEVLCNECGYSLHALNGGRCPECGDMLSRHTKPSDRHVANMDQSCDPASPASASTDYLKTYRILYRIGWRSSRKSDRVNTIMTIVSILALLTSPVWLNPVMMLVPATTRPSIPSWLDPPPAVSRRTYFMLPLRTDAVTTITAADGERLTIVPFVVRQSSRGPSQLRLAVGHWLRETRPGTQLPDRVGSQDIPLRSRRWTRLNFGKVGCSVHTSRTPRTVDQVVWRLLPSTSLTIESVLRKDYNGDLAWVPRWMIDVE